MTTTLRRLVPPDREIIVRTGDSVAYLRLPSWAQLGFFGALAVALAWIGLATHLNFNHLEIIAKREARIVDTEKARGAALGELARAQHEIDLAARRAQTNREHAKRLAERNGKLRDEIDTLTARLADRKATIEQGEVAQQELTDEIADLKRALAALDEKRLQQVAAVDAERARIAGKAAELDQALADSTAERRRLTERIDSLLPQIASLEQARERIAGQADALQANLAARIAERDSVAGERDKLVEERDAIAARFTALTDQLAALESAQEQVISRFDSQTVDSIELVEKTLARTGVDVDRLLGRLSVDRAGSEGTGIGGPFIAALDETGVEQASELAGNIAAVEQRVTRWRGLQELLARVPLTVPLDNFRVTSTYGRRIDPMTSRPAMHEGIDFSSEHRAEVRSTSPGKVTFVGWRGGYGKMVEVDHGLGIRTRYAHLSKIYVKAGQKVDFRDKLGQVGNTGRSTGEHLHYEVMVDGRALDPANFMKAGQYVFKN